MNFRAPIGIRLLAPSALTFFIASPAHAQRIPEEFIWFAGTSLLAPFVAIPVKLGTLRLFKLNDGCSRLWFISAIEWLLWFPLPIIVLRYGRPSSAPMIVLALFAFVVWVHKTRLANASWPFAFSLSLPTPVLALLLPFLAFGVTQYLI